MRSNFQKLKLFVGEEALKLCFVAIAVGILLFSVEACFVYVLQGFLLSIKLLNPDQTFLPSWYPQDIVASSLIFVAFGFTRALAYFLRQYSVATTSQAFALHQRSMLLEYALYHTSILTTHEITTTFNERVNWASIVLNKLSDLMIISTSLLCLSIFALNIAPFEFLMGVTLLSIFIYPLSRFKKKIKQVSENINKTHAEVASSIFNSVRNNFFLKVHGLLENELKHGRHYLRRYKQEYSVYQIVGTLNSVIPSFVGILVVGFVSYISLNYIHTPAMKLLSFFYIFVRIAQGASDAYSALGEVHLGKIALKHIYDWNLKLEKFRMDQKADQANISKNSSETFPYVDLEARDVSFEYNPGDSVFSDLNFKIRAGNILLIQGPSGVGKSTLLSVLMGVNKPTSGEILVNGQPLLNHLPTLRNSLAFVGPEPFLKPDTIRANLMYGHPSPASITDQEIKQILKQCRISEIIESVPKGLDYYLNEFAQLSTGQKQRLSLARALLRHPKLLILDEATANLDKGTEEDIISSLAPSMKTMTVIIVSHKDTFNYLATEIIQLRAPLKIAGMPKLELDAK